MKKNPYLLFTKCVLFVMFYVGILCTLSLPLFFRWYGTIDGHYAGKLYLPQTILYFIGASFCCLIVFELKRIIRSVEKGDCFAKSNVRSLKRMSIYSFAAAVASGSRLILYVTPGPFAMMVVFLLAGLLSGVLAEVFDKAVDYKEENDFTV